MRCALISVAGGNEGCVMTLDGGGECTWLHLSREGDIYAKL